jgi:hypothetical protein
MNVRELIKKLSLYKEELQDKHKLEFTKENVDYIIIT